MTHPKQLAPKRKHLPEPTNSIVNSVGKNGVNAEMDVKNIINLLNLRKLDSYYKLKLIRLKIPQRDSSHLAEELTSCIYDFQKCIQGANKADGIVSPAGTTILYMGGVRSRGKHIIVDMDDQKLYAYDGRQKIYEYHCVTGDEEHPTATTPQLHHTFRRHKTYRSQAYNAQMNYAMFFTYDGKAIHQSNAVTVTSFLKVAGIDSLGSHGCVRLSEDDASKLFQWTPMNTPVFIDMA
ncbi:L,D-transpeptidase [Thalassomonas viridans]|uniref:L,D-transpeptidase n=1 Tax=Thalassomonas viridans TaxID=137584 RepID=A0AAE9Z6M1_9GAMM|nr:L,D-transpeptidase [Thalassomonas viridans]WDE07721.1 L,D-transpeptidase [Thalassomonas viridans]